MIILGTVVENGHLPGKVQSAGNELLPGVAVRQGSGERATAGPLRTQTLSLISGVSPLSACS